MTLHQTQPVISPFSLAQGFRDVLCCDSSGCACHRRLGNLHCPSHSDRTPSLSVTPTPRKILLHCFAGCAQADLINGLRRLGLWKGTETIGVVPAKAAKTANGGSNISAASAIWDRTKPASGTLVETYLNTRGIVTVPPSLRFCSSLYHVPSQEDLPAMVAGVAVWPGGTIRAVHRTYLAADGKNKVGTIPNKMALGPVGGGSVWLALPGKTLAVTEGIETGLSVQQATGIPTWAALSASNLPGLLLPDLPLAKEIVIAADNDRAGLKAAYAAAETWSRQRRSVRIALPPEHKDFNDLLRSVS